MAAEVQRTWWSGSSKVLELASSFMGTFSSSVRTLTCTGSLLITKVGQQLLSSADVYVSRCVWLSQVSHFLKRALTLQHWIVLRNVSRTTDMAELMLHRTVTLFNFAYQGTRFAPCAQSLLSLGLPRITSRTCAASTVEWTSAFYSHTSNIRAMNHKLLFFSLITFYFYPSRNESPCILTIYKQLQLICLLFSYYFRLLYFDNNVEVLSYTVHCPSD
jgi:hypothetical protein